MSRAAALNVNKQEIAKISHSNGSLYLCCSFLLCLCRFVGGVELSSWQNIIVSDAGLRDAYRFAARDTRINTGRALTGKRCRKDYVTATKVLC
ncbi:hypothetical protein [Psittacid alphaherpesvirus 5]|nr:hypothetical protein [Psittacid alphaherpesvirus 5]